MRCVRQTDAPQSPRICEAVQSLQIQGQQGTVAQIAVGRLARNQPLRLTIVVPNNISFPSNVSVFGDENDTAPMQLAWRRCLPAGCFADIEMNDAAVARLRSRTQTGRIQTRDGGGRDVALPISFRGLAQAMDALAREQR